MSTSIDRVALGAGLLSCTFAASGLVNTTEVLTHPGWVPVALAVAVLAAWATLHSGLALVHPRRRHRSERPDQDR